jgi:antitoxin ChpS
MEYSTLRNIDGAIMVEVPPALLDQLHLDAGSSVAIAVEGSQLVLKPRRPKYKLADLLAQCDYSLPMSEEEREWIDAPRAGRELI